MVTYHIYSIKKGIDVQACIRDARAIGLVAYTNDAGAPFIETDKTTVPMDTIDVDVLIEFMKKYLVYDVSP